MKTKFFFFAGLLAACLTSCSEMDEFADNTCYTDDGKSIKIEVTDEFAQATTRANYSGFPATTFEEGDAIGVYAFNGSSYVSSNVKFTRQSDGTWTPASTVVYNPDYTYYAYFPWRSSTYSVSTSGTVDAVDTKFANFISDGSNYFWQANQSTKAGFTYSNLMIAKGIVTGTRTVKFTMAHKRGLAIISSAVNQWYYADDAGTKYNLTPVFSGNIPYEESGTRYFLMKPNTTTSVAGLSLRAGAGKYMRSEGIEMTGSPSYTYSTSTNSGSSWSSYSSSRPSWLTITANVVDGEPTEFSASMTSTKTTSTSKGSFSNEAIFENPHDAALKAASPVSNVDLSMRNNDGTPRGSRTTANCYLVHAPGTYKIPLVYGNAIKNGDDTQTTAFKTTQTSNTLQQLRNHTDAAITTPWIKTQIGSCPDGAKLVWEDVQGMISSVSIDTSDNGYLTFTVDADKIAEGNAVIAATLGGTVVWSWHIWVTTETLNNTTVVSTGSHAYTVAPVNVGQVNTVVGSGTIYAGSMCRVRATANGVTLEFEVTQPDYMELSTVMPYPSPYYQWGRKDAMYPPTGAYNSAGTLINTYTSGTTLITATSATPGATIKNPDYWYYNSSNYGPYGTNSTYAGKYNYWDMNQTSTGNISTKTIKTVYDPCPPDFCVPTSNLWYFISGNSGGSRSDASWNNTTRVKTWSATTYSAYTTGPDLLFPASGRRNYSNGSLGSVGSGGYYWSASADISNYGHSLYFSSSSWNWSNYGRAFGFPVRAVAEE